MKSSFKMMFLFPLVGLGSLFGVCANAATPTANEVAQLLANDAASNDQFGFSVAVDGDTVVVGAYLDDDNGDNSGSAYVFTRTAGVWTEQQKLTASDGANNDVFGRSVAVDGDTIVVGARGDDNSSGSAYVFTRPAGTWTEQQKLTAGGGASGDQFGSSVDVAGDTVVVGAYLDDDKGTDSGSAYVFTRTACVWTQQQKLTASDGASGDRFGWSVAVDGDTVVIGAYLNDDIPDDSGSAYVFTRSSEVWTEQQKLAASDGASGDQFGSSVDIAGDTVVVGAWLDDDKGSGSGSAYVFTRSATAWTEQQKLTASDGASADQFGWSVDVDGDTVVIGAPLDDDNGNNSGSAYVFTRSAGVWGETRKLLALYGQVNDILGLDNGAVGVSGSTVVAGASGHDGAAASTDSGAAYVFSVITDDEGPITSNVLAKPNPVPAYTLLEITATVDDTTTGGSNIAGSSYTLDGGAGSAMAATDDTFDSPTEDVTATIAAGLPVGVYNVCVSGEDAASNTGAEECAFLAVYDPSAGFVTGGGWIDSPAGAYVGDSSLTGKANFGFVAKYKKGQSVPAGNTEFQFKAGNLNFKSTDYEWLVVASAKGIFKGSGTISGAGNYGFQLSAIDAALTPSTDRDLFRIKIWDKDNGDAMVYDNDLGTEGGADPTTAIGGGSIVIHTGKDK